VTNDDIGAFVRALTALFTAISVLLGLIVANRMNNLPTKDDHNQLSAKVEANTVAIENGNCPEPPTPTK